MTFVSPSTRTVNDTLFPDLSINSSLYANFSNLTNSPTNVTEPDISPWFTFIAYWELFVFLLGTPMNLSVICIWLNFARRNSTSNRRFAAHSRNRWFILSMTLGDLLFASVHAPIMFVWYGDIADMNTAMCYLYYGSTHLSTTLSSMSLLLLNIDKFIYLHWPLHYHNMMTTERALVATGCCWFACLGWTLVFLLGPFNTRGDHCEWRVTPANTNFYVAFLVFFFLLPIILSTITSMYIAAVAWRARLLEAAAMKMYGDADQRPSSAENDDERKVMLLKGRESVSSAKPRQSIFSPTRSGSVSPWRTVTFVFTTTIWSTLTYLPYRIAFVAFIFTKNTAYEVFMPLMALMVTYAAGNPFITIITQPHYRHTVTDTFLYAWKLVKGDHNTVRGGF